VYGKGLLCEFWIIFLGVRNQSFMRLCSSAFGVMKEIDIGDIIVGRIYRSID
jgi:hypothetical protein